MSKTEAQINRILTISKRLLETSDMGILIEEFKLKWGLSERQFYRLKADAEIINEWHNRETDIFREAAKKEVWLKIAEKNMEGVAKIVQMLVDMASGNYYNEVSKHTKEGIITYKEKISDKGQQNAMKQLIKYAGLFESIFENNPKEFIKMAEALNEIKNGGDENLIAIVK